MKALVPRLRTRNSLSSSSRMTAAAIRIVLTLVVLALAVSEWLEVTIGCFPAAVLVAQRGGL